MEVNAHWRPLLLRAYLPVLTSLQRSAEPLWSWYGTVALRGCRLGLLHPRGAPPVRPDISPSPPLPRACKNAQLLLRFLTAAPLCAHSVHPKPRHRGESSWLAQVPSFPLHRPSSFFSFFRGKSQQSERVCSLTRSGELRVFRHYAQMRSGGERASNITAKWQHNSSTCTTIPSSIWAHQSVSDWLVQICAQRRLVLGWVCHGSARPSWKTPAHLVKMFLFLCWRSVHSHGVCGLWGVQGALRVTAGSRGSRRGSRNHPAVHFWWC